MSWRGACVVLLAVMSTAALARGQDRSSQPESPRVQELNGLTAPGLLAIVLDVAVDPPLAQAAAERLITRCSDPDAVMLVGEALSPASGNAAGRTRILNAIAGTWNVPERLFGPVAELGRRADPATATTSFSAVAAFRSIDAARLLVDMTAAERPGPVRAAAFASLIEMTGRDDLGSDPAAWSAWLNRAAGLNEAQWKDMLAEGIWRGAHRLAAERAGLVERMQDGYRRLYLSLPTNPGDERTKLTVQLLQSPLPELRGLAVEILNRELAAGNAVNSAVTDAAVALLRAPEPGLRAAAGRLLVQLSPAEPGPLFARALDAESDPDVATSLLAGIARWPTSQAREPVFRWLDRNPAPVRGTADATLALVNAGFLNDPGDRERVLIAMRRANWSDGDPATCKLVVSLGNKTDCATIVSFLRSESPAVRAAAADALAESPDAFDAIVDAATRDPGLFGAAVKATVASRSTAASYQVIERLSAPSEEARKAGLMQIAAELTAADLLQITSRQGTSPELREAMLGRLTEHGAGLRHTPHIEDPAALSAAIMLLAESRLDLRRPDLALVALDALPTTAMPTLDPERIRHTRVVALLWSNRIAQAAELDAPVGAWLDGLERAVDEPHARAIAREIRTRFGKLLDSEQISRFNQLTAKASQGKPDEEPTTTPKPAAGDGG